MFIHSATVCVTDHTVPRPRCLRYNKFYHNIMYPRPLSSVFLKQLFGIIMLFSREARKHFNLFLMQFFRRKKTKIVLCIFGAKRRNNILSIFFYAFSCGKCCVFKHFFGIILCFKAVFDRILRF